MRLLRTFGRTFVKSISDFSYYSDILKSRFSFSLKYLLFLVFLVSLVPTLTVGYQMAMVLPKVPNFVSEAQRVLDNLYPKELILTIDNGKIKTNVKEPYYIDFEALTAFNTELDSRNKPTATGHLITIDTKATVTDYPKYNTAILIGSDFVVTPDDRSSTRDLGGYQVFPLSEANMTEKVVIDKKVYDEMVVVIKPYFAYIPGLLYAVIAFTVLLGPVLLAVFTLAWKLFYLLIMSLVLLVVAKLMKKDLEYAEIYRFGMHGLTLPIVISVILGLMGYPIPFVYTGVFLVFMILVLSKVGASIKHSK